MVMETEIGVLIAKLDELTWGFRIEKLSERGCTPGWEVFYISPIDKVWRREKSDNLITALENSVLLIERQRDGIVTTFDTQSLDENLMIETSHSI